MKKINFLSIIPAIIIIIGIVILSSCSTPSDSSSSSQVEKSEASNQASIDELMLAVGRGSKVVQVAAGNGYSMAIVRDSRGNQTLWGIGNNSNGQLGLGYTEKITTWQNTGLRNVTLVATSVYGNFSYCISKNYLYVTGDNYNRQLGIKTTGWKTYNWTKTVYGNISALACGTDHGMFISWGNIWVAGRNSSGQLGLDPNAYPQINDWMQITQSNNITQIACGGNHSMYLDNNANLYVTGSNSSGQLGLGYTGGQVNQWTKVTNISSYGIKGIACSWDYSIIYAYGPLLTNSSLVSNWLWVTGNNDYGQIGLPQSTGQVNTWKQLAFGNISDVACGMHHSMFVSGNLWVTGYNSRGQLGIGSTSNSYGWQQTSYGNIRGRISAGYNHSLFISQNNTWGAGDNAYMELGVKNFKDPYSMWFLMN